MVKGIDKLKATIEHLKQTGIGVLGAGQMGVGIAQVALAAGFRVHLVDVSSDIIDASCKNLANGFAKWVSKNKLSQQQADKAMTLLSTSCEISSFDKVAMVIEAATEEEDLKLHLFNQLSQYCQSGCILATNTSSISITRIAKQTHHPAQVVGMHFMNPVPLMALVEVIAALQTSDETIQTVMAVAQAIGKTPIQVRDGFGFVANRILLPMINEAIYVRYENLASCESIDAIMRMGMNHPMGPLALADMIGLDTCLAVMEVLYQGFNDSKYRPCPLLKQMVDAGYLGKKTGQGFYQYN